MVLRKKEKKQDTHLKLRASLEKWTFNAKEGEEEVRYRQWGKCCVLFCFAKLKLVGCLQSKSPREYADLIWVYFLTKCRKQCRLAWPRQEFHAIRNACPELTQVAKISSDYWAAKSISHKDQSTWYYGPIATLRRVNPHDNKDNPHETRTLPHETEIQSTLPAWN